MSPTEHSEKTEGEHPPASEQLDRFVDDLRAPLTVIHASAQLLQRRIRRGSGLQPDYLLAQLAAIERASRAIEGRLREFERGDHRQQGNPQGRRR